MTVVQLELGPAVATAAGRTSSQAWAEDVWNRHGQLVYSMACALVGDEAAAMRAVALGMVDLVRTDVVTSAQDAAPALARHVYWHTAHGMRDTSSLTSLPPAMAWLAQLAQLQRAALALCALGGFTHSDAAELMGITPDEAAQLLTSGLNELRRLSQPVIVVPAAS